MDLAGSPKNASGFCLLVESGGVKNVTTKVLHSDGEILAEVARAGSELVAVDAPMVYEGGSRRCDELMREYGALPVTLRGMETLARRGKALASEFSRMGVRYVEVFSTGSAKILGVYSKDDFTLQKNMMALDLQGDVNAKILSRDELDAVLAAVTGYLRILGETRDVGDENGRITVPNV